MKKALLSIFLFSICASASGQTLLDRNTYLKILGKSRDTVNNQAKDTTKLVSEYTFRNLVRNDFSVLLTGDKNKTVVGRYASLEINEDEQKINVTPIAIVPGNNPLKSSFHWIHSVDLSATLNGKKLFNFEDRKTVTAGYSITYIGAGYKFFKPWTDNINKKPKYEIYESIHQGVYNDFVKKYDNANTINEKFDISDFASDSTALEKAYLEKVKEYEEKLAKKKWGKKTFWWVKLNATALSFDNFKTISASEPSTFMKPKDNTVYNPSIQLSGNIYWAFRQEGQLYLSAFVKAGVKHSLSEISSAEEWRSISPLGDSSFISTDKKDVFVLSNTDIKTKLLPDFGFQAIYLFPFKEFQFGINVSANWNGIVAPSDNGSSYVNIIHTGIVFPIKDKDGESTINIEPFWERKSFINYNKEAKNIGGIKFSLPFHQLL